MRNVEWRVGTVLGVAALLLAGCQSTGPTGASTVAEATAGVDVNSIAGPASPCFASTSRYQYCPGSNFPYHWRWSVQGSGGSVTNLGTGDNCYHAEVSVADSPVTLTFHQSNPVGVPQVYDVRKYIVPRECEARVNPEPN